MKQKAVSFQSDGLELEGVLGLPDQQSDQVAGVVICHPHPLMGGNMDNPVVMAVQSALIKRGLAALRFNFRDTGNSHGTHGKGETEPADVKGALELLKSLPGVDRHRIGLVGYSFGAGVILGGFSKYNDCKSVALISPSPRWFKDSPISKARVPKLFISGDQDSLVPPEELKSFADSLPPPVECKLVEGADHFWGHHTQEIASQVADFFVESLK